MNLDLATLKTIVTIVFLVLIGSFAIVSLLAAAMFIRYGRTPGFTVLTSIIFGGVFFLGTLTAYLALQTIF